MAAKKDDPMNATHYAMGHAVGPFAPGQVVAAEELHASFGIPEDAPAERAEKSRAAGMKRLLDLGAITPADAPEPPAEPEPAPKPRPPEAIDDTIPREEARKAAAEAKAPEKAGHEGYKPVMPPPKK